PHGLIADSSGYLFGTTEGGGGAASYCGGFGCGTGLRLSPGGTSFELLHVFARGPSDGAYPHGLIVDCNGCIFGTTAAGGGGAVAWGGERPAAEGHAADAARCSSSRRTGPPLSCCTFLRGAPATGLFPRPA